MNTFEWGGGMEIFIAESTTIKPPAVDVRFLFAARAVMGDLLIPAEVGELEVLTEKHAIFISDKQVTRGNVDRWASQLMVMTATGMTEEFIFCVPYPLHNQVSIKLMANSRNVTICVHEKTLILYYGNRGTVFSKYFSLYGVVH